MVICKILNSRLISINSDR